jgi:hypothetical protein
MHTYYSEKLYCRMIPQLVPSPIGSHQGWLAVACEWSGTDGERLGEACSEASSILHEEHPLVNVQKTMENHHAING